MPADKGKVVAALEAQYKGKLTKNFIGTMAEQWAPVIDTDEAIDAYVEGQKGILTAMMSEGDRRATNAAATARADAAKAAAGEPTATDQPQQPAAAMPQDAPEWFKAWAGQQAQTTQQLTDRLNGYETTRQVETLKSRFEKDERLKGIAPALLHGRYPTTEANFEAAVTETAAVLKPFANVGFPDETPSGAGAGQRGGNGVKAASTEQVKEVMAQL